MDFEDGELMKVHLLQVQDIRSSEKTIRLKQGDGIENENEVDLRKQRDNTSMILQLSEFLLPISKLGNASGGGAQLGPGPLKNPTWALVCMS